MTSDVHIDAAPGRRPTGWIISPLADISLLLATPLAIVPIVYLAAEHFSPELIFVAVASFASIGHHLPGFMRAYGDRELFRRFRWRFLLAPPLILATALFFASRKLHGLELIVLVWATWHIIMQTYGLMRIYDLKRGLNDATSARLDFSVCIAVFVAGILFSQTRLYSILDTVGRVGIPVGPPSTIAALRWGLGVAISVVLLAYAIRVLVQTRAEGPSWAKIALLLTTGWLYWSCGSLSTNLLIGVAMFEIFHAAQYYAIVWSYNRRLADRAPDRLGPLRFMFAEGWLPLAMYAAAIAVFGSINWFTDGIDPSTTKTILLTLLLTSTTLHFYYDGFIWKVSERGTQQNLGIEAEGKQAYVVPGLTHAAKWAGVAAIAAILFRVEASGAPRTPDGELAWLASVSQWTPDAPELLVQESQFSLARGETAEAIAAAKRAVQFRPNSPDGQAALGSSLLHVGHYEPAAIALRQAVALAPNIWENHYDLAQALSGLEQWPDAEQQFEIAASQRPLNAEVQKAWADMCVRRGSLDSAVLHYRAALALAPESVATRSALVQLLIQQGNAYFRSQRKEQAEQSFRQAIAVNPNSASAHLQLGYVYFLSQRLDQAEQSFRRSIELSPGLAEGHGSLGALLLQRGRIPEAKQSLLKALEISPNNAQTHYNLGLVLLKAGDLSEARSQLQLAERLGQPASPEIRQAAGL